MVIPYSYTYLHGLRTPNEGINQRYLKNWANVADKICCRHTKKFGSGSEFSAVQWRLFPLWASVVRDLNRHDDITGLNDLNSLFGLKKSKTVFFIIQSTDYGRPERK